jgi:hypothetical protein
MPKASQPLRKAAAVKTRLRARRCMVVCQSSLHLLDSLSENLRLFLRHSETPRQA